MNSNRNHRIHFKTYKAISLLFILALIVMIRQLVTDGYFSSITEDTYTFTSWAWQFGEALKEGILYPRWMPLDSWGYGSPIFILYSPLSYYFTALFTVFTGSVITAMNITKFLALFFCGVGMFFLVREFYTEKIALLTSSFYILVPFNIFQFYFVGTFASTVSLIWFAPVIMFTYRYMREKQYKDILYAGLCYGGLILTHITTAYMFTFVLGSFILSMSIVNKDYKNIVSIIFIITIGIFLSSAYLLPVLFERKFFTMSAFISHGYDFSEFFILPNRTSMLPRDSLWPVYYDTFVFFILLLIVILTLSLILMLKSGLVKTLRGIKGINIFFFCTAIGSLLLLFGISSFVWVNVPFFRYIQFPYRWLNITTFAVVFLSAIIFYAQDRYKAGGKYNLFIVIFFLTIILPDYRYINSAHVFRSQSLTPVKVVNWGYEKPKWVDEGKIDKDEDITHTVIIQRGKGITEIAEWQSAERVIKANAQTALTLRIRTFYFPGWRAYLDGVETPIKRHENIGAMLVSIPRGIHTLVLKFEDTPIRYISKLITVFSLFVVIILSFLSGKMKRNR